MTSVIVTGHGHFPTGLLSAVSLVAGKPDSTVGVDFEEGMSSDDLRRKLEQAIAELEGDEILILADLVGGTPFNMATAIKLERSDKHIQVIAGANMPALVEAIFSRGMYTMDQLVASALNAGKEGLVNLDALNDSNDEPEFEDGL